MGTRQVQVRPEDVRAGRFVSGLAPVWSGVGDGFIDKTGQFVTRTDFDGKYGFVNTAGEIVIQPQFSQAGDFSDGWALAQPEQNGPEGFIDKEGHMVIGPNFFTAYGFSNGLALAETEKSIGYIDKSGTFVWEGSLV